MELEFSGVKTHFKSVAGQSIKSEISQNRMLIGALNKVRFASLKWTLSVAKRVPNCCHYSRHQQNPLRAESIPKRTSVRRTGNYDIATGFDRSRIAVAGSALRQSWGGRPFMMSSASATAIAPIS